MKLTKLEKEILNHRLMAPDAICDSVCPTYGYNENDVADVIDLLNQNEYGKAIILNRDITFAVLADCVEGGTWYALSKSVLSPKKLASHARACKSLARKISEFIGREVNYPLH